MSDTEEKRKRGLNPRSVEWQPVLVSQMASSTITIILKTYGAHETELRQTTEKQNREN